MTSSTRTTALRCAAGAAAACLPIVALTPHQAAADGSTMTIRYELTTTGDCDGITLTGESGVPGSEFVALKLGDDDGDGVFTGSQTVQDAEQVVRFMAYFADLEQNELAYPAPIGDVETRVVRELGTIDVSDGPTLEASFDCGGDLPQTGGEQPGGASTAVVGSAAAGSVLAAAGYLVLRRRRPAE